jgi:hypothetical protein
MLIGLEQSCFVLGVAASMYLSWMPFKVYVVATKATFEEAIVSPEIRSVALTVQILHTFGAAPTSSKGILTGP